MRMYTKDEFLEMLQNGQDAETLAQSFIDELNAALEEKQKLDEEAQKTKRKLQMIQKEKESRVEELLTSAFDLLEKFYPEIYSEELRNSIKADKLVDAMDEAYVEICGFSSILNDLADILDKKGTKKAEYDTKMDPIDRFLSENGLF